eukprot:241464-Rhodomonas_salina.5
MLLRRLGQQDTGYQEHCRDALKEALLATVRSCKDGVVTSQGLAGVMALGGVLDVLVGYAPLSAYARGERGGTAGGVTERKDSRQAWYKESAIPSAGPRRIPDDAIIDELLDLAAIKVPIVPRFRYAMSGTDVRCSEPRSWIRRGVRVLKAVWELVGIEGIALRYTYAMCGTDLVYGGRPERSLILSGPAHALCDVRH